MAIDENLLQKLIKMQKALHSSLRLKDVLEACVTEFSDITGRAKVAVFLADNEGLSFKLMSHKGYSEASVEEMRSVPFTADSLLRLVMQKRESASRATAQEAPDLSQAIMKREGSQGQIVLPLQATNLLVGAIQIDLLRPENLALEPFLKEAAEAAAGAVANSILFGRSEFEKERLNTLHKAGVALSNSALRVSDVLQIAADTSLVISNTPCCAILMVDPQAEAFRVAAFKGLDAASLHDFDLSLTGSIAGRCLASGKTEYVAEASRYPHGMPRSSDNSVFGSAAAIPMMYENDQLGVLMVFSTDQRAFSREQIELLEQLMAQACTAMHIALTHESATSQIVQDAHTGLYNQLHFEDSLVKEIERSQRHKRNLTVMLVDLDHLARINEYFGREKGDEAIKHVAQIIRESLRDIDVPCRIGGEKFGIILPETPVQKAADVAERVRQKVRKETAPGIGMVTISVGMAAFPDNADDAEPLLKAAEQALDVAKFEGRDRVKIAEVAEQMSGPIPWEELAKQARLAVVSERQAQLQNKLAPDAAYQPWMRAQTTWSQRGKKEDE
jgi:diguanylate cyclase (GGDEF)-like protein